MMHKKVHVGMFFRLGAHERSPKFVLKIQGISASECPGSNMQEVAIYPTTSYVIIRMQGHQKEFERRLDYSKFLSRNP